MTHVDEIIEFFSNHFDYDFNKHKDIIKLTQSETIKDLETFLDSHISILKDNSGNKRYLPYYDRLYKVYLIAKI